MPYADPNDPRKAVSQKAASARYYAKNKEREIARSRTWSKANTGRVNRNSVIRRSQKLPTERVLFNNAKNRAKACNLPFNLEVSDLKVPDVCPVFGMPLVVATGHAKDNSPSVDRIDPSKGYVKGNVKVISHKANTMKSNGSLEDLKAVVRYMERFGAGTTWH